MSGIGRPVSVTYKADIFQNTGIDWSRIGLTLSTGNPSRGAQVSGKAAVNFHDSFVGLGDITLANIKKGPDLSLRRDMLTLEQEDRRWGLIADPLSAFP
ncbi:MAG: DUF4139 domain-containing protein [Xanthomonadaceae bacterium]|nr:DUF4139 domain-containing protein [Xanthomonadaceae bacterium]